MIPWKSLRLLPFPGLLTVKTVKQARRKAVAKILLWSERDLSKMRSLVDCASVKVLLLLRATLQTGDDSSIPHGLVVRIRRSHRHGPGNGSYLSYSFRSVVVITSALHAEGRQFNPDRKQTRL